MMGEEMTSETSYDAFSYPSLIFLHTHPDRMATMARLHGLDPAPVETARVLEVGGGDGANVIAMAASYPKASFYNFDLAASAVARGQAVIKASGLTNVRVEVGDIVDAAREMTGPYDYIIVHGVYAWVPDFVREAIWQLIARVLSPKGVAYISYNALPGGHIRRTLRDMLLRHVEGIDEPEARLAAAHAFLAAYGAPREEDRPLQAGIRVEALNILEKPPAVLFHDELGEWFSPQALSDLARDAEKHGLQYLTEANVGLLSDGFAADDAASTDIRAVVAAVQRRDDDALRFFRHSLFVRADRKPDRRLDVARLMDLYVSARCEREGNVFTSKEGEYAISNEGLAAILDTLSAAWPQRFRITDLTDDKAYAHALYRLFDFGLTELHSAPAPYALAAEERPRLSPLVRAQLEAGQDYVHTLAHHTLTVSEDGPRAFMLMLDGQRTVAELRALWAASPFAEETGFDAALARAISAGLLVSHHIL